MKHKGFSLIELMIVVAIVAFLAAISIPNYFRYLSKAQQTEVALNLAALHAAQQTHWAEHGEYSANLSSTHWKPAKNCNYTYGFNVPGAVEGQHFFVGKSGIAKENLQKTKADKSGFIAGAAADLTGKGKIDIWTIDESRSLVHVQNGIE